MSFSEVLIEITGGEEPLCTIKEIAQVMRKKPSTVYGYREGNQPNWDDAVALATYLIKEHGYYRLAMQTMLTTSGGTVNGRVDDEAFTIMEAIVDIRHGFKRGEPGQFQNGMGKLTQAYENLKAEGRHI